MCRASWRRARWVIGFGRWDVSHDGRSSAHWGTTSRRRLPPTRLTVPAATSALTRLVRIALLAAAGDAITKLVAAAWLPNAGWSGDWIGLALVRNDQGAFGFSAGSYTWQLNLAL